jgi:trehalose 6-phosphate phosphatase
VNPSPIDDLLRPLAEEPKRTGIFCDFDGALSEIVDDPDEARPVDGATEVLARLAERFVVVVVLSGRSLASLRARFDVPGVRLIGLYGIEQALDGEVIVTPEAEASRQKVDRAAVRLQGAVSSFEGVHIEHKGLAVGVHYRRAAQPDAIAPELESIVRSIAAGERLSVVRGRRVLEVRPRVSVDKGETVRQIIAETGIDCALVAGDDIGDIPMFDAVASLSAGVKVVVDSIETPSALRDRADVSVPSPQRFLDVLRRLADLAE